MKRFTVRLEQRATAWATLEVDDGVTEDDIRRRWDEFRGALPVEVAWFPQGCDLVTLHEQEPSPAR